MIARRAAVAVALVAVLGAAASAVMIRQVAAVRALSRQVSQERAAASAPAPAVSPVSDEERAAWRELAERLRRRYPAEADLPAAMSALADWARASGLQLVALDVEAGAQPGPGTTVAPLAIPAELTPNPRPIRLLARHRYRDLVRFVDGLGQLPVHVAVQSLDLRRTDDRLTGEMRFTTLRWSP